MADEIEAQKTAGCSFKYVLLDMIVSFCEKILIWILIYLCPKFLGFAALSTIGTVLKLLYLGSYCLGVLKPDMSDLYAIFIFDRTVTVLQMFMGWPSLWYIVIMVGMGVISTAGSACNLYSIYSIIQKERAEIEEKRLLAIEAIRAGAPNSAKLFDFVIYHSECYTNYLQYYGGERAYNLSYSRLRKELDLLGDKLV